EGSSRYASNIRARSTRPAGSVRDCAITLNFAVSASSSASSIACRHAAICPNPSLHAPHRLYGNRKSTDESPAYDNFYGIDRLVRALFNDFWNGHDDKPVTFLDRLNQAETYLNERLTARGDRWQLD